MPPHMPQIQVATHLPKLMKIFIYWVLEKKVRVEMEDQNLMQYLGPWLDPTLLLSLIRLVVLVKSMSVRLREMRNIDAVLVA